VLATLFVAVSGYQIVEARGASESSLAAGARTELVQDSLAQTQETLAAARDSLTLAREELENLRRLTSRLTPYCSERGETDRSVARIVVLSPTTYRLDGATVGIAGVASRLNTWLDISRAKSCRFGVDVVPTPGLAADDFMKAREPLSRLFYFR
jgi:hypothetical protein